MFHKFKITTCAFILCLFGLTLMTVTPVFAEGSIEFKSCQQIKWKGNKLAKKNCFKDLATDLMMQMGEKTEQREPIMTVEEAATTYCTSTFRPQATGLRSWGGQAYPVLLQGLCEEAYIRGWNRYTPTGSRM